MSNQSTEQAPSLLEGRALMASLTVRDLEASVAWYTDALGFAVDRRMERGGRVASVALRAGDVRILLNQDDGAKGLDRVKGEGSSLMISISGSVDDVAERIKAHGGTLDSEPTDMPWGGRAFRVRDPDGFRLAVSSGM